MENGEAGKAEEKRRREGDREGKESREESRDGSNSGEGKTAKEGRVISDREDGDLRMGNDIKVQKTLGHAVLMHGNTD